MTLEVYLAYLATVGVFFASPPGPSQLLMISNSMRFGARASVATVAGDLSANALQMTAAAFGLAAVVAVSGDLMTVVKWLGVGYLVFVGVRTFLAPAPSLSSIGQAAVSRGRLFRQGFLTSSANPKAIIFFAALFPQFIDASQPILPQLMILGATYIVVDGTILMIYGAASERAVKALAANVTGWLNRVAGAMMIGAAVMLGLREVEAGSSDR